MPCFVVLSMALSLLVWKLLPAGLKFFFNDAYLAYGALRTRDRPSGEGDLADGRTTQ
jgi:hypothetical protein